MAAGKQDSRQKMINMMYLVFIAMLALNIGKEVLATLGVLNVDLEKSVVEFSSSNDLNYKTFEQNKSNNYYAVASSITPKLKVVADDYFNYLKSIKDYLISKGDNNYKISRTHKVTGEKDTIVDYQIMDKSQDLDELFFTPQGSTEKGEEFTSKYQNFPNEIISLLDSLTSLDNARDAKDEYVDFDFSSIRNLVTTRFNFSEYVTNRDGAEQPFLEYHYKGFPKIASLAKISKMQSDIRYVENKLLNLIRSSIADREGGLNTYQTLLETTKSSYYTGERVDAAVVMGKKDSSFEAERVELSVNGKPLLSSEYKLENGKVVLNKKFSSPGIYKLEGELKFLKNDELQSVAVNQEFSVINRPNMAVISAVNNNVLYKVLPNPLSVSIPGVPSNSLRVSSNVGSVNKKGNLFEISIPFEAKSKKVKINVSGSLDGNTISPPPMEFLVKSPPPPEASLKVNNDFYTGSKKVLRAYLGPGTVSAKFPEWFNYNLEVLVTGFDVKIGNLPSKKVDGNRMSNNSRVLSDIKNSSKGTAVSITNIKTVTKIGGKNYKLPNEARSFVLFIN